MTYTTTELGLQLPVPGSGQAWSTAVYNQNLQKLEDAVKGIRPRIQSRDVLSAADSGGTWASGSSSTLLEKKITVPGGTVGVMRANVAVHTYLAGTTGYAGNLYITVDGVNVQTLRIHNQNRAGFLEWTVSELGFSLSPGEHTIQLRRTVDGSSATFEVWMIHGNIVTEF